MVLIDELNTSFEDQASARQQIVKFLQQIQPQDHVALYVLRRQLSVLHDFTTDPRHLLIELARYTGRPSTELGDAPSSLTSEAGHDALNLNSRLQSGTGGDDQVKKFLRDSFERVSDFQVEERVRITLGALEAIANHLAGLPGRKNLIWVSSSFPIVMGLDRPIGSTAERRTFGEEIKRVGRAFNNANLAIYPVDARGLVANPIFSATQSTLGSFGGSPAAQISTLQQGAKKRSNDLQTTLDTMKSLANESGGRAFFNTNNSWRFQRHNEA